MLRFFLLLFLFSFTRVEARAPTLPPHGLRVVLCHVPRYKASDLCKDHTEAGSGEATTIPASHPTHRTHTTSHHTSSHSITFKITIPFLFFFLFYILLVLFLRFHVGFSWKRAFSLGTGQLCHTCVVHVYHRPDLPA